jgi:hypothetical protein
LEETRKAAEASSRTRSARVGDEYFELVRNIADTMTSGEKLVFAL